MPRIEFSKRERDVIALLLEGKSNKQIAQALGVSESTIEFHLGNLYKKLGVNSKAEAIVKLNAPGAREIHGLGQSLVAETDVTAHNGDVVSHRPATNQETNFMTRLKSFKSLLYLLLGIIAVIILIALWFPLPDPPPPPPTASPILTTLSPDESPTSPARQVTILVDDFSSQSGQDQESYSYNRLDGERGTINNSLLEWGGGQVTMKIPAGTSWGGVWMSLNHPMSEGLPINFSAILPEQILPAYQARITSLQAQIVAGTPGKLFRLEFKERGEIRWKQEVTLQGGPQFLEFELPVVTLSGVVEKW